MKFKSNFTIGESNEEYVSSPKHITETKKDQVWNTYYSSSNDTLMAKGAFKRIDSAEKAETPMVPEHKRGVQVRNEFLKSSWQENNYIEKP